MLSRRLESWLLCVVRLLRVERQAHSWQAGGWYSQLLCQWRCSLQSRALGIVLLISSSVNSGRWSSRRQLTAKVQFEWRLGRKLSSFHRTWCGCSRSQQKVDALTEIQTVTIGEVVGGPFGIVPCFPECSECLIIRFSLVVEQCCPLGCNRWLEFGNASLKPVWVLPLSLAKGVHDRVVNDNTDVTPSFFSAWCGAVPEGLFNRIGEALTQVWDCCASCVNAWASFLLGTVDTFGLKAYFSAHQRVVGVAVSALVTTGTEDTADEGPSSDNEIQLVPVVGSGVAQGYLVVRLG